MKWLTILTCALALSGCDQKIRTGYPTEVTVEQIAAEPNKFVGKKVYVSGYLHSMLFLDVDEENMSVFDFELYPTKETYLTKSNLGLRVQIDSFSAKVCDAHYVSIIGSINADSEFHPTLGDIFLITNHSNVPPLSPNQTPAYKGEVCYPYEEFNRK